MGWPPGGTWSEPVTTPSEGSSPVMARVSAGPRRRMPTRLLSVVTW
jgi:hypothetical protein